MSRAIGDIPTNALPEMLRHASDATDPVVVRGVANGLPIVAASREGEGQLLDYLSRHARPDQVTMIHASKAVRGKFGYGADLKSFNFTRTKISFGDYLATLRGGGFDDGAAVAVQGVLASELAPGFAEANVLPGVPGGGEYRLWLGTRAEVATHCDPTPNLAYVACGKRRFTLFAPEEIGNLYLGPFDPTPSGTQISLADPLEPDDVRFPRFRAALDRSKTAVLEPGDAIFIPAGWYHHVESLAPLNLLVNYWWRTSAPGPSPWDALMHGFLALRSLPPAERRAWRAMFDHYIFEQDGDPAAHLPKESQGILARPTPGMMEAMRQSIIRSLTGK